MTSTPDQDASTGFAVTDAEAQPLRDGDTSIEPDPTEDPAQAEWDRTTLLDAGVPPEDLAGTTATGDDPDEIGDEDDEIPATTSRRALSSPRARGSIPSSPTSAMRARATSPPNDY